MAQRTRFGKDHIECNNTHSHSKCTTPKTRDGILMRFTFAKKCPCTYGTLSSLSITSRTSNLVRTFFGIVANRRWQSQIDGCNDWVACCHTTLRCPDYSGCLSPAIHPQRHPSTQHTADVAGGHPKVWAVLTHSVAVQSVFANKVDATPKGQKRLSLGNGELELIQ